MKITNPGVDTRKETHTGKTCRSETAHILEVLAVIGKITTIPEINLATDITPDPNPEARVETTIEVMITKEIIINPGAQGDTKTEGMITSGITINPVAREVTATPITTIEKKDHVSHAGCLATTNTNVIRETKTTNTGSI